MVGKAKLHLPCGQAFAHRNLRGCQPLLAFVLCRSGGDGDANSLFPWCVLSAHPGGGWDDSLGSRDSWGDTRDFLPSMLQHLWGSTWPLDSLENYSYFFDGQGILPVQGLDSACCLFLAGMGSWAAQDAPQSWAVFKDGIILPFEIILKVEWVLLLRTTAATLDKGKRCEPNSHWDFRAKLCSCSSGWWLLREISGIAQASCNFKPDKALLWTHHKPVWRGDIFLVPSTGKNRTGDTHQQLLLKASQTLRPWLSPLYIYYIW